MHRVYSAAMLLFLGCSSPPAASRPSPEAAPRSLAADHRMLTVSAGPFIKGSTQAEREQAYDDYLRTAGKDAARRGKWFQYEPERRTAHLPAYRFDRAPVTQAAFAEFIADTGNAAPTISQEDWQAQRFIQDYETEVKRFNWQGGKPPASRLDHPVVLVPWKQASEYCQWRGRLVGQARRLPTPDEFEKAARGPDGAAYPWGETYDPSKLNSADLGERDTSPVASFVAGRSFRGADDVAGNVFQWTSAPWPRGDKRMTVKGSAWDDHGGLGRAAAAHGRPAQVRHVIVGFRCAASLR